MADLRAKYTQITRELRVFLQGMKPFVIHTRKVRVFLHKGKYRCHSRLQEVPLDCRAARTANKIIRGSEQLSRSKVK